MRDNCSGKYSKINWKALVSESLFIQVTGAQLQFYQKKTLVQVLSCEFCDFFQRSRHLWV